MAKVKREIVDFPFFGGLEVDLIKPGCPTEELRQLIDWDFSLFMESMTAKKLLGVVPRNRRKRKPRRSCQKSTAHAGAAAVVPNGSGKNNSKDERPRGTKPDVHGRCYMGVGINPLGCCLWMN